MSDKTGETKDEDSTNEENESKTNLVSFSLKVRIMHYQYLKRLMWFHIEINFCIIWKILISITGKNIAYGDC